MTPNPLNIKKRIFYSRTKITPSPRPQQPMLHQKSPKEGSNTSQTNKPFQKKISLKKSKPRRSKRRKSYYRSVVHNYLGSTALYYDILCSDIMVKGKSMTRGMSIPLRSIGSVFVIMS